MERRDAAPRPGQFFGQANLNGPLNVLDVRPSLALTPIRTVTLLGTYGAFWRASTRDGLYDASGLLLRPGGRSAARFVGQQLEGDVTWTVDRHALLLIAYQYFVAGPFLRQTPPGRNVGFTTAWVRYQW